MMTKFLTLILPFLFLASNLFAQLDDWYVIDLNGDTVKHIKAEKLMPAGEDFIIIKKNGLYGLIDYAGRSVLKVQFEEIKGFSEGFACVKWDGLYGYMDEKGRMLIPARYEEANPFKEGLAAAKIPSKDRWGFINKEGVPEIDHIFYKSTDFSQGYAATKKFFDRFYAVVNKEGKLLLQPVYEELEAPKDGLIRAKKQKLWGYIDLEGNTVIEHQFKHAYDFGSGAAFFSQDGYTYGVIDDKGNILMKPAFEAVKEAGFGEGLGAVRKNNLWGYVNKKGELAIPHQFEDCGLFKNGRAMVKKDGLWGCINPAGEFLISPRFESLSHFFPVRRRPVAVAKGADYTVPNEETETEPEEEVTEEETVKAVETVEKTPIKEETVVEETASPPSEKPKFKVTSASSKPVLGKEAAEGNPMLIAQELESAKQSLDDSRLACTQSLVTMKKAHELGTIAVFAKEAAAARKQFNSAIRAYNAAQNHLKGISRVAETNETCYKLLPATKLARIQANRAGQQLKVASEHLDKAVSEEEFNNFSTAIKAYFDGLEKTETAAKELRKEIENCLMN